MHQRNDGQPRKLGIQQLESRQLMAGDLGGIFGGAFDFDSLIDLDRFRIPDPVPAMESNPGAEHTIYLDFNGHDQSSWAYDNNSTAYNIHTPALDIDGNPSSLNVDELKLIEDIFQYVAEDFAPFDVNVTTVNPELFDNGEALRIAIGGSYTDWLASLNGNQPASGIARLGSFEDSNPNVVFVFSEDIVEAAMSDNSNDGEGRPLDLAAAIGTTASHEAGHGLGLNHHPVYNSDRTVVINDYHPGTDEWTPIMGNNLASDRTTWSKGDVPIGAYVVDPDGNNNGFPGLLLFEEQDDVQILTDVLGARPDDHSDYFSSPATLAVTPSTYKGATTLAATGIIETTSDFDVFFFETDGGTTTVSADVLDFGANLDVRLELWRLPGKNGDFSYWSKGPTLVAKVDPDDSLSASYTNDLSAASYVVVVASHGNHGDLGQYTVTVTSSSKMSGDPSQPLSTNKSLLSLTTTQTTSTRSRGYVRKPVRYYAPVKEPVASQPISTIELEPAKAIQLSDGTTSTREQVAAVDEIFAKDLLYDFGK